MAAAPTDYTIGGGRDHQHRRPAPPFLSRPLPFPSPPLRGRNIRKERRQKGQNCSLCGEAFSPLPLPPRGLCQGEKGGQGRSPAFRTPGAHFPPSLPPPPLLGVPVRSRWLGAGAIFVRLPSFRFPPSLSLVSGRRRRSWGQLDRPGRQRVGSRPPWPLPLFLFIRLKTRTPTSRFTISPTGWGPIPLAQRFFFPLLSWWWGGATRRW